MDVNKAIYIDTDKNVEANLVKDINMDADMDVA